MAELHLLSPRGFRAGAVHAGIKSKNRLDVALLACDVRAAAAAVFTTSKVFAAPIKIGRANLRSSRGMLRGVVVNSGNANACTGARGERDAQSMCVLAAQALGCDATEILPSSTGIIGHPLPMPKIRAGIERAASAMGSSREHALQFSEAILTTDLVRKTAATRFKVGKEFCTIAGVCKGSGMIGPRMGPATQPPHATMLAYLTTDAKIPSRLLQTQLTAAADASFNVVTVDDHASTNDTAAILTSGFGPSIAGATAVRSFAAALGDVCQSLAYQIAADGEGATKVVKIVVRRAGSAADAQRIARSIAVSPLVKCAMNGNDPNWGRIVSAAGYCGADFDPDRATLRLQNTIVFRNGSPIDFDAAATSRALKSKEVVAELTCNLGKFDATVWTCDLSKEYVAINADYHT